MAGSVIRFCIILSLALACGAGDNQEKNQTSPDSDHYVVPEVNKNLNFKLEDLKAALSQIPKGFIFADEMFEEQFLLTNESRANLTETCIRDTYKIWTDLTTNSSKEYVKKYLDAAFKPPSGFLQGKWNWMGDYEECMNIDPVYDPDTKHTFSGKHFLVGIYLNGKPVSPKLPVPLFLGICMPDSCDNNTVYAMSRQAVSKIPIIDVVTVTTPETPAIDAGTVAAYVVLGIFATLVILGTALDLWEKKNIGRNNNPDYKSMPTEKTLHLTEDTPNENIQFRRQTVCQTLIKLLKAFSFTSNTERLLGTSTAVGPLACLNGLRVISMWWVIQGHTYEFSEFTVDNVFSALKIVQRFDFQAIGNGTFSVDSFFFLSGLLVAYLALKELNEKQKMNWVYFFCHRFWRLTPLYAVVLMFFTKLFIRFLYGPFQILVTTSFTPLQQEYKSCETYWWTNLLYINNFCPDYGSIVTTCMPWTWYLANDMQFYIFISPIFILLMNKHRRLGLIFAFLLIISCVVIRGWFVVYYGLFYLGGNVQKNKDPWSEAGVIYQRPYTRMAVYVVGLLTGYILIVCKCKVRMSRPLACLGWVASASTALAVVYGQYYYNSHPAIHMKQVAAGFYISLARFAWSVSLSWLVVACASGFGGPINSILSFKIWAPLGRLTYAAYLVHPMIIYGYYVNLEEPFHFTDYTMIYTFLGNLVLSYGAAYLVSIAVEAPMMQIEKVLLKKQK